MHDRFSRPLYLPRQIVEDASSFAEKLESDFSISVKVQDQCGDEHGAIGGREVINFNSGEVSLIRFSKFLMVEGALFE